MRTRVAAGALLLAAGACTQAAPEPTRRTMAALPLAASAGVGASVPFDEYEAENARYSGKVIGPDRRLYTLPAEASGRRAVLLERAEDFVAVTLARPADGITIRYAIPDAPGGGRETAMAVIADGRRVGTITLTSRYTWLYGRYPFSNDPREGRGHHVFDHARIKLPRRLPAGTVLRFQPLAASKRAWVAIDLVDAEMVAAPLPPPPGALSLTAFGADPAGGRSSRTAFRAAVAAARSQGKPLYLPPGRFRIDGHVLVDRVTIAGAGMWHSVLLGSGLGIYGRENGVASRDVHLSDFAILGDVAERDDHTPLSGIGGAIGGGSTIERLWLQHHKVGLWFDGPMSGIRITGLRIFDMTADGLNFHRGIRNAIVEDTFVRGSGDDGLAAWSGSVANDGIVFRRDTVIAPTLANGIALYGGRNLVVRGNLVADSLTQGGGIHVGNRFHAVPLSGRVTISRNVLVRAGSFDPNWRHGVGALWFYALDAPIRADVAVSNLTSIDGTEEAVLFIGSSVEGVTVDGLRVRGAGAPAVVARSAGGARLRSTTLEPAGLTLSALCDRRFVLTRDQGEASADDSAPQVCSSR